MLRNNLHPDVAEKPSELVVYGGIGKAARNWSAYHTIERELKRLGATETLLVQSGKPVAVFETHPDAPRVLIANSNLVPQWATWEKFRELDAAGLMMYGQMTAGSWIYIGSQGILQGTYETFAAAARKRFDGTLAGRLVVTAGLGGMGGAQPLAITMLEGAALCIEVDLQRIERRIETGYLDERAADLDDALARLDAARAERRALSIGLAGNAAEILPELVRRGVEIDIVTDQTSAHDPLNGYVPAGLTVEQADALRRSDPGEYLRRVGESAVAHVGAIRALQRAGAEAFDYGNALRGLAAESATRRRSPIRASSRPTSGRCSARARGRSGGSRCRATRLTSTPPMRRSWTCSATRSTSPAGSRWRASACIFRGFRRGSAGWATASAIVPACASTRWSPRASSRADRDRPRPPRRRLGGLARARDGGDARRLGRGGRLAAAQRDADDGLRGELGVDPPRRRCRDGQVDPRRPGGGRRRDAGGGRARAAHADRRSRARAWCATPTPAIRRRSRPLDRSGIRMPMLDPEPERPVSGRSVSFTGAEQILRPRHGRPAVPAGRCGRRARPWTPATCRCATGCSRRSQPR